jgi:hypothetical protein
MARSVQVLLVDDLDGSPADETVRFGLDGVSFEIDLSARHAGELRGSLSAFVAGGRRVGREGAAAGAGRRVAGGVARSSREQNRAIRAWARRKKLALSERGRIPAAIVDRYVAEAGR